MPIRVYDYHQEIANLVVHPEIRGRFMQMQPSPAGRMHSHDLGGEIFLVLEGQCEFLVEDERVTCGPGQLIYVEPRLKHTLHAVGDQQCIIYLSVTPHVEPTHTQYDEQYQMVAPRYGTWRGKEHPDPNPDVSTTDLAGQYAEVARTLAHLAQANANAQQEGLEKLQRALDADEQGVVKETMDELWYLLRSVLEQVSATELSWNALAPRGMPTK